MEYPATAVYLPDAKDHDKLPRQWLISLLYTLIGRPFADWALEAMEERNQKIMEKQ